MGVTVCLVTFALQMLVLLVNLRNGMEYYAGCFHEPPSRMNWWLLHVSKACAMLVAGVIMGKDLMDTVNYWLVSSLLQAHQDFEVITSAILRIALTTVIVGANVAIFMQLTNPASVWLNMTALGFIAGLSQEVLSVAKQGVFGHHIGQTLTKLNFQLTFHVEYPGWFIWARAVALLISLLVVLVFATYVFISPDNMCDVGETVASVSAHVKRARGHGRAR